MYYWTEETRKMADEVLQYISNGKAVAGAPAGTQEKYDKMLLLLQEEKRRMIDML